ARVMDLELERREAEERRGDERSEQTEIRVHALATVPPPEVSPPIRHPRMVQSSEDVEAATLAVPAGRRRGLAERPRARGPRRRGRRRRRLGERASGADRVGTSRAAAGAAD